MTILVPIEVRDQLKLFMLMAPIVAVIIAVVVEYFSGKGSKTGGAGPGAGT